MSITIIASMELNLPEELLKRLDIGSGLKYCVENGFAIFVGNPNAESNMRERTDKEQVIAILLNDDSKISEISEI
jgi:hypothetical protein